MALEALTNLLEDDEGGIWFLPAHIEPRSIQKLAKSEGFAFFHIDGKNINRKEQLMNAVATALHFPKHFGNNWDALEECLTDLEWVEADGYLIYYDHIDGLLTTHPAEFETLVEILRDSVAAWREDGEPMVVLLSGGKAPKGVAKLKSEGNE